MVPTGFVSPTTASMVPDLAMTLSKQPSNETQSQESLPAYYEATDGCVVTVMEEKTSTQEQERHQSTRKTKSSDRFATLKSILSGSIHRHNPMYVLERSLEPHLSSSSSNTSASSRLS